MTFKILDPSTPPPGGWYYVQPEDGRVFQHYARNAFFAAIRDHRLQSGYPIEPDWMERIEDEICRNNPQWGKSICGRIEHYGERRPIDLAALQSFLNVMASWIGGAVFGRGVFVSQEEAERRAVICAGCEFNMNIGGSCGACVDRVARALSIIGARKTAYDDQLEACSLCSCALKVAVHVPLSAQQAGLSDELKSEFRAIPYCWKRENLVMGVPFESLPEHVKRLLAETQGWEPQQEPPTIVTARGVPPPHLVLEPKPRRNQLEKSLHRDVYNELLRRRIWFVDSRMDRPTTQRKGIPDFICCVRGEFLAIELKRPGEKPKEEQIHEINEIRQSGGRVCVATSLEEVIFAIRDV